MACDHRIQHSSPHRLLLDSGSIFELKAGASMEFSVFAVPPAKCSAAPTTPVASTSAKSTTTKTTVTGTTTTGTGTTSAPQQGSGAGGGGGAGIIGGVVGGILAVVVALLVILYIRRRRKGQVCLVEAVTGV